MLGEFDLYTILAYRRSVFWNFDVTENSCLMVVFFLGLRRCTLPGSSVSSETSAGRAMRTAVNKLSRMRCRPKKRSSRLSRSRQAVVKGVELGLEIEAKKLNILESGNIFAHQNFI